MGSDVRPGLAALRREGRRLAILSNGEPRMLEAAARSAGSVGVRTFWIQR